MVFKCSRILERSIIEQKSRALRHERSSVGARPSSAAPVEQNHLDQIYARAPTKRARVLGPWSCPTGAAEDDRAPTEELSCVRDRASVRWVEYRCKSFLSINNSCGTLHALFQVRRFGPGNFRPFPPTDNSKR